MEYHTVESYSAILVGIQYEISLDEVPQCSLFIESSYNELTTNSFKGAGGGGFSNELVKILAASQFHLLLVTLLGSTLECGI